MATDLQTLTEGDAAFTKVDARRKPDQLEAGLVSAAVNVQFDQGRIMPRLGVASQAWGTLGTNLLLDQVWPAANAWGYCQITLTLEVGVTYSYTPDSHYGISLTTGYITALGANYPDGTAIAAGTFTATQTTYYLWAYIPTGPFSGDEPDVITVGGPVNGQLMRVVGILAMTRFNDPEANDALIVITDEVRADGGVGRAWRLNGSQSPVEIPLNGHDVWGECRLIQCYNAVVLLRSGPARHYFAASAIDDAADTITLNTDEVAFATGERVLWGQVDESTVTGTAPPVVANYYTPTVTGDEVTLAGIDFDANAVGRFYLEKAAVSPGFYGNDAPPLIMQGNATQSALEVGFATVPSSVVITDTDNTTGILTAPNHRLQPGQPVQVAGIAGVAEGYTYYAAPQNEHTLKLYDVDEIYALADDGTNQELPTSNGDTGTLKSASAAGLPMPPAREGIYYKSRLILVNGDDRLCVSDPLDPLHFTPMAASVTANLGEADRVTALVPLGEDTLLVLKTNSVLGITGLSGASDNWALVEITREYGCLAPLTVAGVGRDVWFLSRRGVVSIVQTELGKQQGVALPVSDPIAPYLAQIDWANADKACAAVWNNRYFLSVPGKGQTDTVTNNQTYPYNFLNQGWEGQWTGSALQPVAWSRFNLAGEERLAFASATGTVNWLQDDWNDLGEDIATQSVTTRGYLCGSARRKLFLSAALEFDQQAATVTVTAVAPGWKEETTLLAAHAYDRTKYLVHGTADFDPDDDAADWDAAHREDYTENLSGDGIRLDVPVDAHQNIEERLRLRVSDRSVQLRIANATGSLRLQSVLVEAVPAAGTASRQT